jgi:hypothetical protein
MATFAEEVQALGAQFASVRTALDAKQAELTTALFNRLRPLAALSWMSDTALTQACQAFTASVIRSLIPPAGPL